MKNFCEQCGTKLQEGAAFCSKCGASTGVLTPNKGKKAVVIATVAAVVLILAVAVASVALYLRSDGYQCRKNMKLADRKYEAEEYKEALTYYNKALALDNTLVEAYVKSADIYVMEDSFEDAKKILKKGLKKIKDKESKDTLNDYLVEVYLLEANFYLKKEDYEQAIAVLKEGQADIENGDELEKKLVKVYQLEADYYLKEGDDEQAIAVFEEDQADVKDGDGLENKHAIAQNEGSDAALADIFSRNTIKVGIINNDPNESGYRTANDNDLKATFCEANGYDASFAYSSNNEEQITAAQKFIQDGVDYLLLSAAYTAGWDSTLQDAQAAGVRVILFDRVIDASEDLYEASIVSDMDKEGQTAVEWLAKQGLSEYNIIHLQGVMGTAAQKGRSGALYDKAASAGWNLVTQQTAEWNAEKARQIVQSVIESGESFNVIYAENDDMAKGAVAALDNANISHGVGKDVIIMGFDCNKYALQELLDQNWNYDGQCSPFQASYIDDVIKTLESDGSVANKTIVIDEKGFDARTITANDVANYGI